MQDNRRLIHEVKMDDTARSVLSFWFDEVGPQGWYSSNPALDQEIGSRFQHLMDMAASGQLSNWVFRPSACMALVVLLDQFPRNVFRGDERSFATDLNALSIAKSAIERGHDKKFEGEKRQFFYLPFMHSESMAEQARGVRQVIMNPECENQLVHARAHRWVIRKFGRFPFRNQVLGRSSTPGEEEFLNAGGYRAAVAAVS